MFLCFILALFIAISVIQPCAPMLANANDETAIDFGGQKTLDLSSMFLAWRFRQINQNITHAELDDDYDVMPGNASVCRGLLHIFSKDAGRFIECSVNYARPFKFCEKCVIHYQVALSSYNDIVKNDEKSDNCRILLLNSDRVQIINSVYKDITKMWSNADCSGCFSYVTMDANKTVHYKLTDRTFQYTATYANFTKCLPTEEDRKKHWNATVCTTCGPLYDDLNRQFDRMLFDPVSPHHVCMDIVDMMNYSRLMWGDELNCTVVDRDPIPAMTAVCVSLSFPMAYYVILTVYQKKKLKKLIMTKRLSSYTSSFRSYGTYDNSHLLSGESDTTSNATSGHNSSSPSDREAVTTEPRQTTTGPRQTTTEPRQTTTEPRQTTTAEIIGRSSGELIVRTKPSIEA